MFQILGAFAFFGSIAGLFFYIYSGDKDGGNTGVTSNPGTTKKENGWGFKLEGSFVDNQPESSIKRAIAFLESYNNLWAIQKFDGVISFGIYQFISRNTDAGYSPLKRVIDKFGQLGGDLSGLTAYQDVSSAITANDANFQNELIRLAKEDSNRMRQAQEAIAEELYFSQARNLANQLGYTSAADKMIIFDAFIHYGPVKAKAQITKLGVLGWLQFARDNHHYTGVALEYHRFRYETFLGRMYAENSNWQREMWIKWKYWPKWIRVQA